MPYVSKKDRRNIISFPLYAQYTGHKDIAELALDLGCPADAPSSSGALALHLAAGNADLAFNRFLAAKLGASSYCLRNGYARALQEALDNDDEGVFQFYISMTSSPGDGEGSDSTEEGGPSKEEREAALRAAVDEPNQGCILYMHCMEESQMQLSQLFFSLQPTLGQPC